MNHVEELSDPVISMILDGKKKAEVVFRKSSTPPINCIKEEDQIYFRSRDGYAIAKANVTKVENHKNLNPKKAMKLLESNVDLFPTKMNKERDIYFKYATVFWFDNLQEIKPFNLKISKDENNGWIQVEDINLYNAGK
jgi:hypothetical protein